MRVRVVHPANIDESAIAEAAEVIRSGGVVVFPTETVYGLGADATNADAVAKIFAAKGRPSNNPLIVHVPDIESTRTVVSEWPDTARLLATRFWPGPLTLVLPKHRVIPDIVTAGLQTVGVRVPAHPVALALLRSANRPIAAPSANLSTQVSPTQAQHVTLAADDDATMILDAGEVTVGIESTVLDLTRSVPTILRPGMIGRAELAAIVGEVRVGIGGSNPGAPLPSPGLLDRHYAPHATAILAHGESAVLAAATHERAGGRRVAVITWRDIRNDSVMILRMPDSPPDYARALYATLHRVDAEGFDSVIIEAVPTGEPWDAIRDRLARATFRASS